MTTHLYFVNDNKLEQLLLGRKHDFTNVQMENN